MGLQDTFSLQSPITRREKGRYESESSGLGQGHHDPLSLSLAPPKPFRIEEQRTEVSTLDKKNVQYLEPNLSLSLGTPSYDNLEKSRKTSEVSDLQSPKEGIFAYQPTVEKNIWLFRSNLCDNGSNSSSSDPEKSKQTSEVSGSYSPRAFTRISQSALINRNVMPFGSDLSLSYRRTPYVNQERFRQTPDDFTLSLNSLRESNNIGSELTLGNKTVQLFGSNLCSDGATFSSISSTRTDQISEKVLSYKPLVYLPPYSSNVLTMNLRGNCSMDDDVHLVSGRPGLSGEKMGALDSTHQGGRDTFGNEIIDHTSTMEPTGNGADAANQEGTTEASEDSASFDILLGGAASGSHDTLELSFTSEELEHGIECSSNVSEKRRDNDDSLPENQLFGENSRNEESQQMNSTADKLECVKVPDGTAEAKSAEGRKDSDGLLPENQPSNGASRNQETQEISFTSEDVQHGTSEVKSGKRRRDSDKSKKKLCGDTSKSQEIQEASFTLNNVEHGKVSSSHLPKTYKAKPAKRQKKQSDESLPDNQLDQKKKSRVRTGKALKKINNEPGKTQQILPPDANRGSGSSSKLKGKEPMKLSQSETTDDALKDAEMKSPAEEALKDAMALVAVTSENAENNTDTPALNLPLTVPKAPRKQRGRKPRSAGAPKAKRARTEKAQPTRFPKDVPTLLGTGILDGCPVIYYDYVYKVKKWALILRSSYLCGCQECRFLKPVSGREFVRHCGSNTTRASRLITFSTGYSVDSVIKYMRRASPDDMFNILASLSGTSLNMENFKKSMEGKNMDVILPAGKTGTQDTQPVENQETRS